MGVVDCEAVTAAKSSAQEGWISEGPCATRDLWQGYHVQLFLEICLSKPILNAIVMITKSGN
jgi:hypothetical protein